MKIINLKTLILYFCIGVFFIPSHGQTIRLINKEWEKKEGILDNINPIIDEYITPQSTIDAQGNLYVVSHEKNGSGDADILTVKYDNTGNGVWKTMFDLQGLADYGTQIVIDNSGNIIVCGVTQISGLNFDYVVIKYDNAGNELWHQTYDGTAHDLDVPTALTIDDNDNIYVTGASNGLNTQTDYCTIKYSPNGSQQWVHRYNYAGSFEIPAGIVIGNSNNIYITGGSGVSISNWDFATIELNTNGATQNVNRIINGAGIDKPKAIKRDDQGNIYIVGSAFNPATNSYDMKSVKYNPNLVLDWERKYDAENKDDGANSIDIDGAGNVYIGGYVNRADNGRNFKLLKYTSNGTLEWDKERDEEYYRKDDEIKRIKADYLGNVTLVGEVSKDNEKEILAMRYNKDGDPIWEKELQNENIGNDKASDVNIDSKGDAYVVAKEFDGTDYKTSTVKYEVYEKPKEFVLDNNNKPAYLRNRVLIRFNEDAVNQNVLLDRETRVFSPEKLLTPNTYNLLKAKLPIDINKSTFSCLTSLTPEDKFSTSRLGEQVKIPPLWAAFAFDFPEPVSRTEVDIATDLNALFPVVIYAHPDYAGHLDQSATDPLYSLKQGSLHPVPMWDSAHINVETAWNYSVGESFVKVGVIDDGIEYLHPEFGGNPPLSKVKGGADWTNNGSPWDYYSSPNQNVTTHGTQVAGIIGALRNNNQGVAGIAGGDGGSNKGATLLTFKIFPNGLDTIGVVSHAYQAIVDNVVEHSTHPNGLYWGVHIFNGSFGFDKNSTYKDSTILLLEDAIHFANRNQVTYVASRGNNPSTEDFHFPAIFWDDWVLSVGASGFDGKPATFNSTNCTQLMVSQGGFVPSFGRGMDVIAPAGKCIVQTAINNSNVYEGFSGTSASAPHAAGVAALLMSHHNQPTANFNNLAPEDVEGILETTASFREPATKPSALSGWGLIDAGKAMEFAWKPKYTLEHVCSYGVDTVTPNATVWNKTVNLTRRTQSHDGTWVEAGRYKVDMYDLAKTKLIHSTTNNKLKTMWSVHSLSDTYIAGLFGNDLNPIESVSCCETVSHLALDTVEATYTGNIFDIRDTLTGAHIAWLPYDTAYARDSSRMCISVLTYDSTVNSIHEVHSEIKGIDIAVFPNPSNEYNTVLIDVTQKLDMKVELFDITGTFIRAVWEGPATIGNHKITHEVGDLPSGLYFYRVQAGEKQLTKRFLKL